MKLVDAVIDELIKAAERAMRHPDFPVDIYRQTIARVLRISVKSTWEEIASKLRESADRRNKRLVSVLRLGLLVGR